MTPDDPELPGRPRGSLPPLESNRRPLTEYETAQRLLRLFTPAPGTELTAADWEQGPASFEELRKATPALETPPRPLSGYGLGIGHTEPALPSTTAGTIAEVTDEALAAPSAAEAQPTAAATPSAPAAEASAAPAAPATPLPAGAVAGDGTLHCPPGFPVKANAQSGIYHPLASPSYDVTVPELCFSTPEAAQAAGYRPPKNL
jgi:hypothetical protein